MFGRWSQQLQWQSGSACEWCVGKYNYMTTTETGVQKMLV